MSKFQGPYHGLSRVLKIHGLYPGFPPPFFLNIYKHHIKPPENFSLAHFFMLMLAELGNYLNSPPTTTGC
jgi:hypothetical protein